MQFRIFVKVAKQVKILIVTFFIMLFFEFPKCLFSNKELTQYKGQIYLYKSPDQNVVNLKKGVISFYDRNGDLVEEPIPHFAAFEFANSGVGKSLFFPLFRTRAFAKVVGWYQTSRFSRHNVNIFSKKHKIELDDFEPENGQWYGDFNDFFTRKLSQKGLSKRKIKGNKKNNFFSPADSKLFVLENIDKKDNFWIKESSFNIESFLGDAELAKKFQGGQVLIFRLAPNDYHRFHAPVDLEIRQIKKIQGKLESVHPVSYAIDRKPLENKRAIISCYNEQFGDFIIAPIGAMMIGKIVISRAPGSSVEAGQELGYFKFGGSTVLILLRKGVLSINQQIKSHSQEGLESQVLMGDLIGRRHN